MNDYIKLIEKLLAENKTTGPKQSEALLHYTKLNLQRLQRWLKTAELTAETKQIITSIKSKQHWVVLTEAWCGDAAHSLGIIYKMAELNPLIKFDWRLRDENLALMDQYLTNGGRAIPKLIAYDESGKELFNWGPRPAHIQNEFLRLKNEGKTHDDINVVLQKMYNEDKGMAVQREISERIKGLR